MSLLINELIPIKRPIFIHELTIYSFIEFESLITQKIILFFESSRGPLDFSECESECVAGVITEFAGMLFIAAVLNEYISSFIIIQLIIEFSFKGAAPKMRVPLISFIELMKYLLNIRIKKSEKNSKFFIEI